jgi:uncharacterized low-complexity protein
MKNKKRNSLFLVAIVAIAFAAFSFVSPNSSVENSRSQIASATVDMHQIAFPVDMTTAKCGTKGQKTTKTKKETENAKCGEGKCGSKDVKAAKVTKKAENAKCGVGKCGTKEAKSAKKAKAKKAGTKCGEGKCGEGKGGLF